MISFPFRKIALATLLGAIVATAYLVKQEQLVKNYLYQKIKSNVERNLGCQTDFKLNQINLISPELICKSVLVKPIDPMDTGWSWSCHELRFGWSWWALIAHRKLEIKIIIDQINIKSDIDLGQFKIWPHLHKLIFTTSPVPVLLNELYIKSGRLELQDLKRNTPAVFHWSSTTKELGALLKSTIQIKDGQFPITNQYHVSNIQGDWQLNIPTKGNLKELELISTNKFTIPKLSLNTLYFGSFNWVNNLGTGQLKTITGDLNIDQIRLWLNHEKELFGELAGSVNLQLMKNLFPANVNPTGIAQIKAVYSSNQQITGNLKLSDGTFYADSPIPQLQVDFKFNPDKHKIWGGAGNFKIQTSTNIHTVGKWQWQNQKIKLFGAYHTNLTPLVKYKAHLTLQAPYLDQFTIQNLAGEVVGQFKRQPRSIDQIKGMIALDKISLLLPPAISDQVSGTGQLQISGKIKADQIDLKYQLDRGQIILTKLYAPISILNGQISWNQTSKTVTLSQTTVGILQGHLTIPQAKIRWSNWKLNPSIHLPLKFEHCVINLKSNLNGACSGLLTWSSDATNQPALSGLIIIEGGRSQGNFWNLTNQFNKSTGSDFSLPNPTLDLMILSRNPIQIQSDTLQAQVQLQLKVQQNWKNPTVSGQVTALNGKINLLYKPLIIESGTLNLDPNQLLNPYINLTASTQIKRFNLAVHMNGAIHNPEISFESNPPLEDEQVAALLLTGSENTSLNTVMPALVLQNLNLALLGDKENLKNEHPVIQQLLKPFERIKFIPSFNDETGREGLRGIIKIDINDHLMATVQKNFNLTESSQIEIDYALTDDISLRGIKDERGDLGGEIELAFRA